MDSRKSDSTKSGFSLLQKLQIGLNALGGLTVAAELGVALPVPAQDVSQGNIDNVSNRKSGSLLRLPICRLAWQR